MALYFEEEYLRSKRRYRLLPETEQKKVDQWIMIAKEHFYDARPIGNRIPTPHVVGMSSRMMYILLYLAMDRVQMSLPPGTPPR